MSYVIQLDPRSEDPRRTELWLLDYGMLISRMLVSRRGLMGALIEEIKNVVLDRDDSTRT
jgi:hypothetical protein